jgi:apolipoprotein N-acyltransferase
LGDRRPFGDAVLGHPIVVFAGLAGLGLVILRVVLQRPVPDVIPERAMIVGFLFGIAAFLVGNWVGAHLIVGR